MIFARLKHQARPALVGALAVLMASASPAAAAPGDLDTAFDGDGKVTTDFAGFSDQGFAVAIQGDGKIVAAGLRGFSGTTDFALARYNTDGSLDPTFDTDGLVTTDFAGTDEQAFAVAIQGDGKIVAAGYVDVSGIFDFALARYKTDGSLDTTFSGDGKVTTDFGSGDSDRAFAVAIQADGKIVAAGFALDRFGSGTDDFALARYDTDGSLDTTFDGDGLVTTDFGPTDQARDLAIQGDGKIVAAGFAFDPVTLDDFALARYNSDGSLDETFDGDGKVTTDFAGSRDVATGVAIQGDGKIMAVGLADVSGNDDFALARYNTDGSLDPTFDSDGLVTTDFAGGPDHARDLAIQGDGKIVAAGEARVPVTLNDFALARYKTDGSLDTIFSGDGKVTTDFAGSTDAAFSVTIQGDGKIVAAGFGFVFGTFDFALARYTCLRRTSRPMSIPLCP